MRRLSLWLRRHPIFGDSVLALALLVLDVPFTTEDGVGPTPLWLYLLVAVMLAGPIVVRRRYPILTAYLVLAGGLLQLFTMGGRTPNGVTAPIVRPTDLALGIALYTLVAFVGRRQAVYYGIWMFAGTVAWTFWRVPSTNGEAPFLGFTMLMVFAVFWFAGEFLGARRAYHAEVERRLGLLETERDQQARIAVAAERARIARELHDVVAHAVSVMVVQADGAAYAVHRDPDMAERAVQTISDTGRSALAEMRRLLGVLRNDTEEAERAPQPDAGGLSTLADRVHAIGLPVRLDLSGDLDGLPPGVGLNVYRIIQEALTNTLKHGGSGAEAVVTVHRGAERVVVRVDDNGTRADPVLAEVSGGNGLIGMRERAAVHGGTLEAGPRPGGGWQVSAELPLQPR